MGNSKKLIQLDSLDNILVARQDIKRGETLSISGQEIEMTEKVKLGFKVAIRNISWGEKIIKCGISIGSATTEISIGDIVHVHNIKSDYSPTFTIQNQREYEG